MNLQEKIQKLIADFDLHTEIIDKINKEMESLKNKIEVDASVLIIDLESKKKEYLTYKSTSGKYEFILGGDGRGAPWSEIRQGIIFTVSLNNNIYISDETKSKLKAYINATREVNDIIIK